MFSLASVFKVPMM